MSFVCNARICIYAPARAHTHTRDKTITNSGIHIYKHTHIIYICVGDYKQGVFEHHQLAQQHCACYIHEDIHIYTMINTYTQ